LDSLQPTFSDLPTDFFFDDNADKLSIKLNQQLGPSEELQLTLAESKFINQPPHPLQNGSEFTDFAAHCAKTSSVSSKSRNQNVQQLSSNNEPYQDQKYRFRCTGRRIYERASLESQPCNGQIADSLHRGVMGPNIVSNNNQNDNYVNSQQSNNYRFCQQSFSQKSTVSFSYPASGEIITDSKQIPVPPHVKAMSSEYSARSNCDSIPRGRDREYFRYSYPLPHYHGYDVSKQDRCNEDVSAYASKRLSCPYEEGVETQTPSFTENYSSQPSCSHFAHTCSFPPQHEDLCCAQQLSSSLSSDCSTCKNMCSQKAVMIKQPPDDAFVFRHPTNPVPVPSSVRRTSQGKL